MSSLIETIKKTKETINTISPDKQADVIGLLIMLTTRFTDSMVKLNDIPKSYYTEIQPAVTSQLSAAERRIESATNIILESAEKISGLLPQVNDTAKKEIQIHLNKIFEASGFQDLVSQHLNEITLQMGDLSIDIEQLQFCLSSMEDANASLPPQRVKSRDRRVDAHLLNGPATDF